MTGKLVWTSGIGLLVAAASLSAGGATAASPAAAAQRTTAAARLRAATPHLAASAAPCTTGLPTVTVEGTGTAQGVPDELTLSLGVETRSVTAAAALASNNTKSQAVIGQMSAHGVPKDQIQTSGLSVQPNYDNAGNITSYVVDNDVTATLYKLSDAGALIDAAAHVAGNSVRVNGLQFGFRDQSTLMGQAKAGAVRQAIGQARQMAAAAGMTLGSLCSLQDDTTVSPQPVNFAAASAAPAATTPIEPGSQQVTATVTVIYQLAPAPVKVP